MADNEANTRHRLITPALQKAGWDSSPRVLDFEYAFTDGRIVIAGREGKRRERKVADYLLRYTRDFTLAVVEAKAEDVPAAEGLQQAKEYAEILGLKFAYATNGRDIIEFDFLTGIERTIGEFPTPAALLARLQVGAGIPDSEQMQQWLSPCNHATQRSPRYYQEIAINRAVAAILKGQPRILLTMATGTGKTPVALQICWKLWTAAWNRRGLTGRKPKILFLADRNILVDDPKDKDFAVFGEARYKIEGGVSSTSRDIYFATYQSLAEDERRPGLYRDYASDFFDLVIIDECHRGSARDDSSWREILEWFSPAIQLGLTATPFREESRDTYAYFGNPIYEYSLRQGIADGFLAPYRVHRIITTFDAAGWRPSKGELDRYGNLIPDEEYQTKDFERVVSLRARTEAVAKHLTEYMKRTDRFAKTIVFCVDQPHASEMRAALSNLNADLVKKFPNYVARVTSNEGDIGKGHLSQFQELETETPVILTTSQLLTTGVNAPMVKNVVLVRVIGSMAEFKQIIGRGTRVREDYGKLFFDILDYTGTATAKFADPDFDGKPASIETENEDGETREEKDEEQTDTDGDTDKDDGEGKKRKERDDDDSPRKFFVDGGTVSIAAHLVHELDADGKQLRMVQFTDYAGEKVRIFYRSAEDLTGAWADPERRAELIRHLQERGISFDALSEQLKQPDADPLDLLCNLAFNTPLLTRRERAQRLARAKQDFFTRYSPEARAILNTMLDQYAEHGSDAFTLPQALAVPALKPHGNAQEIAARFGGVTPLRAAVSQLQSLLYSAA